MQALKQTYHYEPVGYTQAAPGEEFSSALVFCRVKSWLTGQRLVSMPFSDHCEPLVDSATELQALLKPAQENYDTRTNQIYRHSAVEPEVQRGNQ